MVSILLAVTCAHAEIKVCETADSVFSIIPYLRVDTVILKNTVDLDSKNSDDSTGYLGIDYSLGFDWKSKSAGPRAFLKLERNGPYDYDAPLFINNTLATSAARVERYTGGQLLPDIEEFWLEAPVTTVPLRIKGGLFTYNVGNDIAGGGAYENYAVNAYNDENKDFKWHLYYCKPDLVNKNPLGPHLKQEKEQGIGYEHAKADFISADVSLAVGSSVFQPYFEFLSDRTNTRRVSNFSTPTHNDQLGTLGIAWDFEAEKLSLGLEAARNFGEAKTSDTAFKSVQHTGYIIYTKASYTLNKITPHAHSLFASGNKVTTEMADNGDSVLTSGKNRAFSAYSPFNTTLADSIYPNFETVPLVAMGGGYGLNYGINRPGTFADSRLLENLMLYNLGFDYKVTDKMACFVNWWYLRAVERGVGTLGGSSRMLSADLGNELDLSFEYQCNDTVTFGVLSGYFFPGKFYKEERDDTSGSLFTPFTRGDGNASGAYQVELSVTLLF
jgi:hypothetical protein